MKPEKQIAEEIAAAQHPEDIFGDYATGVRDVYRELAKLFHPDKNKAAHAERAFKALDALKDRADKKIAQGTYGDRRAIAPITIATKKNAYVVDTLLATGDLCNVYRGVDQDSVPVIVKVTRTPANNDLVKNEATQLAWLRSESPSKNLKVIQHLPTVLDSFELTVGNARKQVNVLKPIDGMVTLEDVRNAYSKGIHLGDAAWMFNRIVAALLAAHQSNVIHGAVLPCHVMILPDPDDGKIHDSAHNGFLIDWSYSQKQGAKLRAIVPAWKAFYPPDLKDIKLATFGLDLYMAAMTLNYILGGTGHNIASHIPREIKGIMRACWLGHAQRSNDVYELFTDFGKALKAHFGPPKFRHFKMPLTKK